MCQFDQVILLDKPTGITSFGCVSRVRYYLSQQAGHRVKVGHCGTLDPFATGLLIVVTGKMTKRAADYTKLDKTYAATFKLGEVSSTGDPEGIITKVADHQPTLSELRCAARQLTGEIMQTPPAFSAIKVNGCRAYQLARQDKAVVIPPRRVVIYQLDIMEYVYPYVKVQAHVSSGTYIRSLAADLGDILGTGAYTTELRRLTIGQWSVADAVTLDRYVL